MIIDRRLTINCQEKKQDFFQDKKVYKYRLIMIQILKD